MCFLSLENTFNKTFPVWFKKGFTGLKSTSKHYPCLLSFYLDKHLFSWIMQTVSFLLICSTQLKVLFLSCSAHQLLDSKQKGGARKTKIPQIYNLWQQKPWRKTTNRELPISFLCSLLPWKASSFHNLFTSVWNFVSVLLLISRSERSSSIYCSTTSIIIWNFCNSLNTSPNSAA